MGWLIFIALLITVRTLLNPVPRSGVPCSLARSAIFKKTNWDTEGENLTFLLSPVCIDWHPLRRKRTGIHHHAIFLGWSLNGVDASRTVATLAVVLHCLHVRFKSRNALPRLNTNKCLLCFDLRSRLDLFLHHCLTSAFPDLLQARFHISVDGISTAKLGGLFRPLTF